MRCAAVHISSSGRKHLSANTPLKFEVTSEAFFSQYDWVVFKAEEEQEDKLA